MGTDILEKLLGRFNVESCEYQKASFSKKQSPGEQNWLEW